MAFFMKANAATLTWAGLAHVCFAGQNFLTSVSARLAVAPSQKWAVMGTLWFASGLVGLLAAAYWRCFRGHESIFFGAMDSRPARSAKVWAVSGGVLSSCSQWLGKEAYHLDGANAGPLTAVLAANTIIVAAFCHVVYRERLTKRQQGSIVTIVCGLVVMVCASPEEEFVEKPWWTAIWHTGLQIRGSKF